MYKLTSSLLQFPKTFLYLGAIKAIIYILVILTIFIISIFKVFPFRSIIGKYIATTNAEEAEWFCEDLQDLLELTKKDVLFILWDWNAKVGSQDNCGVTGRFGLGVQNEAGQKLTVLPREDTGHSKHLLLANKR